MFRILLDENDEKGCGMLFGFGKEQEAKVDAPVLAVNERRCPQNHRCPSVQICPTGALKQKGFAAPVVDQDACVLCGKCVRFCPMGALSLG